MKTIEKEVEEIEKEKKLEPKRKKREVEIGIDFLYEEEKMRDYVIKIYG